MLLLHESVPSHSVDGQVGKQSRVAGPSHRPGSRQSSTLSTARDRQDPSKSRNNNLPELPQPASSIAPDDHIGLRMTIAQPTSQLFEQNDCRKYPFSAQISRLNWCPQDPPSRPVLTAA